jgi:hypothetical protein
MTTQEATNANTDSLPDSVPEWTGVNYVQWGIPGVDYSAVRIHLTGDADHDLDALTNALALSEAFGTMYGNVWPPPPPQPAQQQQRPPQQAQRPPQQQQRPQQGQRPPQGRGGPQRGGRPTQRGGGGQTRASQYPVVPGWACDICGGPCGRYPRTGNMTADKVVCLSTCKDGQFIHTVGWLDEDEGYVDPSDLPF